MFKLNLKNKVSVIAAVLASALLLAGCGGTSSAKTEYSDAAAAAPAYNGVYASADYAYAEEEVCEEDVYELPASESKADSGSTSNTTEVKAEKTDDASRKLIRTFHFTAETEDLDALNAEIEKRTAELGGYIESSSFDGIDYNESQNYDYGYRQRRYANYTIRIPAANADAFAKIVDGASNVTDRSMSAEDITLRYSDTKSRMEALEAQQKNLLAMMDKAQTIEEMIQIENALTDVRSDLMEIKSRLRIYDNQVDYSTIYLNVSEVKQLTVVDPMSDSERMASGFAKSLKDVTESIKEAFIWFVINIPHIIVWIIELIIFVLILKFAVTMLAKVFVNKEARAAAKEKRIEKANARKELKKQRLEAAKAKEEADK